MKKRVVVSISGGKDSIFALYKAMQQGHQIACLFNTISYDHKRVRFHRLKAQTIQKQAKALGLPLYQITTTSENYQKEYIEGLKTIIEKEKVEGLVLGDIFLQDCYDWAKKICSDLKIELIEPLWQIPPLKLFQEFIDNNFEAIVVSTQSNLLDQSWVGKTLNKNFLKDIQKLDNIDICGENGEYHSLVINGPIFKKKLDIKINQVVSKNNYLFLDIT